MKTAVTILTLCLASPAAATRLLTVDLEVSASVEKAWAAWTTQAGVESFFAPQCFVEPYVDGKYEIYFLPEEPPGQRGAEGTRILAWEPLRRFAFSWDAPVSLPDIRRQRTMVIIDFAALSTEETRIRFTHLGWGDGDSWDKAYDYFDYAWNARVLPRFRYVMEHGPVDWERMPELEPVASSLKQTLVAGFLPGHHEETPMSRPQVTITTLSEPITVVGKMFQGDYARSPEYVAEIQSVLEQFGAAFTPNKVFGAFYDNPQQMRAEELRSFQGVFLSGESAALPPSLPRLSLQGRVLHVHVAGPPQDAIMTGYTALFDYLRERNVTLKSQTGFQVSTFGNGGVDTDIYMELAD